jgi:hypothetical protein
MANVLLAEFIDTNRAELIRRCALKVTERSGPAASNSQITNGVPRFLDLLMQELLDGPSKTDAISTSAGQHGKELLREGFTIGQVVHDYGDVCQSVTDLAVQSATPISADDFRTLNRCLDDAIAGAVTEFSRGEELTRDGESQELRVLIHTAITAFETLQTGKVGLGGTTAALVHKSLLAMRAQIERPPIETAHAGHLTEST